MSILIFFFDFDFFFCFIPMKISQSFLGSKDGSKFWCLPWFPKKFLLCVILRYTVYCKLQQDSALFSDICQLRLDFDNFDITETTAGVCTDSLGFTTPSSQNPQDLCGTLTGLHRKFSTCHNFSIVLKNWHSLKVY